MGTEKGGSASASTARSGAFRVGPAFSARGGRGQDQEEGDSEEDDVEALFAGGGLLHHATPVPAEHRLEGVLKGAGFRIGMRALQHQVKNPAPAPEASSGDSDDVEAMFASHLATPRRPAVIQARAVGGGPLRKDPKADNVARLAAQEVQSTDPRRGSRATHSDFIGALGLSGSDDDVARLADASVDTESNVDSV